MSAVLLSTDLMTASRVEGAAVRACVQIQSTGGMDDAAARASIGQVGLLLVDLTRESLDIARLVELVRASGAERPAIVAFGPHVHKERLDAARAAGCDEVLTRGQFFSELDAIMGRGRPDSA